MNLQKQLRCVYLHAFFSTLRFTDAVWVALLAARGFSLAEIGLAEGVFHLTSLLCEVPSGMAADLLGRRRTLIFGGVLGVFSALAMASAPGLGLICTAMALKAQAEYIKTLQPGEPIGYGCTFVTERESRIATLPIGYADGYTRLLAGKAEVEICGQRAKVVGRICMDQCMVDVTPVAGMSLADEIVLFGSAGLTIDEVADWLGTINYEIVCMISPRVPRVYT